MITLRNYQENIIEKCRRAFKQGYRRPLVVLPCGGGKTICFAFMAHNHKGKTWFLVHRKELLDQAKSIVGEADNIFIGMVTTALKKAPFEPTMIIFDEAHHATANTWKKIIDAYPDAYMIGLTATPCRLDGSPLGNIFDCLIEGVDSEWLIENKYLAPYEYYAPSINMMLPKMKGADFDTSQIEYKSVIYGDINKYISDKKTIIYCPNIAFSQAIARQVGGVHFDGNTPKTQRDQIIHDFRNGKIKILCNVDLIGEGFDVPDCECVMLLRPTMSVALYIQQSMRCMRYVEGKTAIIYDFVGNCHRHGLPTDKHQWSLDKKIKIRNSNGVPDIITRMCQKCYRVYSGINPICPYCGHDNHKTQKQIAIEQQAELEQIKKIERREQGRAHTYEQLVALGKKRGYRNPAYWAKCIINGRNRADI